MNDSLKRKRVIDVAIGLVAVGALSAVGGIAWRASRPAPPSLAVVQWRAVEDVTGLTDRGQWLGDSSARVQFVKFSDIECPFCRILHSELIELIRRHPSDVAVLFRHYPGQGHFQAVPAAIAGECAASQDHFEAFVSLLFAKQDSLGALPWEQLASRAGIADTVQFKSCRSDSTARQSVEEDVRVGRQLKIPGTPALIVGRRMFIGALSVDTLEALVRAGVAPK